jgi:hypothetical protein
VRSGERAKQEVGWLGGVRVGEEEEEEVEVGALCSVWKGLNLKNYSSYSSS